MQMHHQSHGWLVALHNSDVPTCHLGALHCTTCSQILIIVIAVIVIVVIIIIVIVIVVIIILVIVIIIIAIVVIVSIVIIIVIRGRKLILEKILNNKILRKLFFGWYFCFFGSDWFYFDFLVKNV